MWGMEFCQPSFVASKTTNRSADCGHMPWGGCEMTNRRHTNRKHTAAKLDWQHHSASVVVASYTMHVLHASHVNGVSGNKCTIISWWHSAPINLQIKPVPSTLERRYNSGGKVGDYGGQKMEAKLDLHFAPGTLLECCLD